MNTTLDSDKDRYPDRKIPTIQKYFRKAQRGGIYEIIFKPLFFHEQKKRCVEMGLRTQIGKGLYLGHPYCITINPNAVIGDNCNIHKGVLIGRENRGKRKGSPVIGNEVWIGINAVIVGNVRIGNDV